MLHRIALIVLLVLSVANADSPDRWALSDPNAIAWNVAGDNQLPHEDHVEMSGHRISTVVFFGADQNHALTLHREVIWPMLRLIPNDTHASLGRVYADSPGIRIAGQDAPMTLDSVHFDGLLTLSGHVQHLRVTRVIFPSRDNPAVIENWTIENTSADPVIFEIVSADKTETTIASKGVYGSYLLTANTDKSGSQTLAAKQSFSFSFVISGRRADRSAPAIDPAAEESARREFVARIDDSLQLHTPDPVLDRMFELSKIRTSESIYATKGGLMQSPGGGLNPKGTGRYYAAIWANDQAEYAGPFFPFLGDKDANDASLNAYHLFAGFMNPDYKPIPSSIIAEGAGTWHGAGDRGDDAMIAYGASRFALASGDRQIAEQLWPLVQWTLEYCHRKLNSAGVVASRRDELEGRLPSGTANLHTSVLTYDALLSGADLARSLGKDESIAADYEQQARTLRKAIDAYFAANVEGFNTYRYYDGDKVLRAWICSPLCAGIMEQKDGTIAALTSDKLWSADGLTTASGRKDFWDRSTLYALRGMFIANEPDVALKFLDLYSRHRLLGEHVPYAVEAYPEGNQSHLAAESALYARIATEGLFGIRPTGLNSFTCQPELPTYWPSMTLQHVHAFGNVWDLSVSRQDDKLNVTVTCVQSSQSQTCTRGQSVAFNLPGAQ